METSRLDGVTPPPAAGAPRYGPASFDENLDRAAYLTDACVYGLFSLHGVSMLFSALADYDREYGHVMPYGDVPLLFMLSAVLFVTKRGYDAAKQA